MVAPGSLIVGVFRLNGSKRLMRSSLIIPMKEFRLLSVMVTLISCNELLNASQVPIHGESTLIYSGLHRQFAPTKIFEDYASSMEEHSREDGVESVYAKITFIGQNFCTSEPWSTILLMLPAIDMLNGVPNHIEHRVSSPIQYD